MLWDNGQHLHRTALRWNDPALYQQIRSSWKVPSGTASTDLLFVGRTGPVTAQTVTLNLNGNSLGGIFHGSTRLARGSDYTLDGDQLTFSAPLLSRLVGARQHGVNAVLAGR